jgi:cobalt-zinc-cadmium efflux system membrane fusion protein
MMRLLLIGFLAACHTPPKPEEKPDVPLGQVWLSDHQVAAAHLAIAPVKDEEVGGQVATSGNVTFDDLRVSHIFSPVAGRVVRIEAQPGQRVKRGAPLAIIESPDVGVAFSDLAKATADLTTATSEYKRQQELFTAKAGAQRDYEAAEDNYNKAKAEFERARRKAALFHGGSVDKVSQEYTLRAPIDGEVIARNVNPGVEVQGQYSGGTPVELFTVGEMDSVWVLADVFEMDLARVKSKARVSVRVAAYPKVFSGVVDWVSSQIDSTSRTARVRCRIPNPERELKPAMYASVTIGVAERRALAVPRAALVRVGDKRAVFVEKPSAHKAHRVFEERFVEIDEDDEGDWVPIESNLTSGEQVVTSGAILLLGML